MTLIDKTSLRKILPRPQISLLAYFLDLLAEENKKMNLIGASSSGQIIEAHLLDSLSLLDFEEVRDSRQAIDVGSGAGFPGIPLAIALPNLNLTLLDSNAKKCGFLSRVTGILGLSNVEVIWERAETAGRSRFRDNYDLALARALGPLPLALEYVLPFVEPGGHCVLQRGQRQTGDTDVAAAVACLLSGELDRVTPVKPYPSARNLHVWVFTKVGKTPTAFPRRPGQAKKRPLAAS